MIHDSAHVLLTDDEVSLCGLVKKGLLHYSGNYQIDMAHSGSDALECLRKQQYDVMVADIRMP